ncbi:uncharacterized protein PITG_18642 [Phytophthora infestans T30-4]|uniref:DNA polymerase eta n=1 Tax=Phytophthora infestans (strain T30-4) TaxID=403677 RepID=D0NYK2_PHYIT|nr:uncharacterized protein PITG_18642 [Phytophthora infestans T30-4]EEY68622.1 conserved hypothetical protein [Phytophthora infestans T30-4]|eukprot:XP_002997552.1 conserved hypothetical protein [Phytophthora infestans T30-4]
MLNSSTSRVIIHLDLDCFYAQVEQRRLHIPDGQPVAVQQWGSLLAVNYDARKFGVERGDFIDDAKKKCPQIHLPHVDTLGKNCKPGQLFDRTHQKAILRRYRIASRDIFAILGSMVPIIEKASIDEAFMDVTDMAKERIAQTVYFCQDPANHDTKRLLCIGAVISREIRQAIYNKLGYTCSTGIAGNKLLAKLASPLNKPNGQVVVASRFVIDLMKSLPMRKIRGLGGKLGKQLETAGESFKKLSAHTFLQRCGLIELAKHVGQETAAYVHSICQGSDDNEPVEEKKVQVKITGVRLLCEEVVIRCEDERIENKRFPSQLSIQFIRAKPGEKPRSYKLGIGQDTTVDELYTAAMNVMRLHVGSMFPMATLIMNAKNFHELDSQAVATISSFFTRDAGQAAPADLAAQRMEEEIKQFATKRDRDRSPTRKSSRQKILTFFGPPTSSFNGNDTEANITPTQVEAGPAFDRFCEECRCVVSEPRAEHADFHFALKISQTQRNEVMASAAVARQKKKKKKGPLDAFLGR